MSQNKCQVHSDFPPVRIVSKNETGIQSRLSVSAIQSVEWQGPLPTGQPADNHTIVIVGMNDGYICMSPVLRNFFGYALSTTLLTVAHRRKYSVCPAGLSDNAFRPQLDVELPGFRVVANPRAALLVNSPCWWRYS